MTADCLAKDLQRALHSQGYCHVASGEGPQGMGQGLPLPEDIEGGHMPLGALTHWGPLGNALALQSSNAWLLVLFQGCEVWTHGLQRSDSTVQVSKCSPNQQMQSKSANAVQVSKSRQLQPSVWVANAQCYSVSLVAEVHMQVRRDAQLVD